MKNKSHLTAEGLDQIRQIKAGMNRKRDLTELESKKNKEKKNKVKPKPKIKLSY
jgi:hypothetical protein